MMTLIIFYKGIGIDCERFGYEWQYNKKQKVTVSKPLNVDFNQLQDIKNYSDLLLFLNLLKNNKILLSDTEYYARSEALRLQLMASAQSRNVNSVEKEVIDYCSQIYSAFADAIKHNDQTIYNAKINEVIGVCQQKTNAEIQGSNSPYSSHSSHRSTPSGTTRSSSSNDSPRHLRTSSRQNLVRPLMGGNSSTQSNNHGLLSASKLNTSGGNLTKVEFLELEFSQCANNKKPITLSEFQETDRNKIKKSSEWLGLIETEYNKLRNRAGIGFFCSEVRVFQGANFFERAFEYAQNLYGKSIGSKDTLSDDQKLWIVLKYAEAKPGKRTKDAVDAVIKSVIGDNQKAPGFLRY